MKALGRQENNNNGKKTGKQLKIFLKPMKDK